MAANQTACPPVGVLKRLLAEDLPGQDRDTVESHVETCSTCQEQLAHLSASSFPSAATGPASTISSDPEPNEGFLRRLRETAPRTATRDGQRLGGGILNDQNGSARGGFDPQLW